MKKLLLFAGILALAGCASVNNNEITRTIVFSKDSDSCHFYRIPAMTLDRHGNIIAVVDRRYDKDADIGYRDDMIDLGMKRSTDGGRTWSEQKIIARGGGDASLTLTKTGRIVCVMADATNPKKGFRRGLRRAFILTSDDGGISWDAQEPFVLPDSLHSMFATSGKGICDADGDILLAASVLRQDYPDPMPVPWPSEVHLFYSKDDGETWTMQPEVANDLANESKLALLPDGRLILSARRWSYGERGLNTAVKGEDGIWHWEGARSTKSLLSNPCNCDILTYDKKLLLHTYIRDRQTRSGLVLACSLDGGESWADLLTLEDGPAAYSTMVRFRNGDVGVLYEAGLDGSRDEDAGHEIVFARIPRRLIRRPL